MTLIDSAITGIETISAAGNSNIVLTSIAGQPDQARNVLFNFTGALTGNIIVFWPNALPRNFRVNNATSGAFTLTVAVNNGSGSPAGTTYAVPQGLVSALASDGTNITQQVTDGSQLMGLSYYPETGGFLLGNMTMAPPSGTALLGITTAAGIFREIGFYTGSNLRWLGGTDGGTESGGNAGSNFFLNAYNDAGALIAGVYNINRATQIVTFTQPPAFTSPAYPDNSTKAANTAYVTSAAAGAVTSAVATAVATSETYTNTSVSGRFGAFSQPSRAINTVYQNTSGSTIWVSSIVTPSASAQNIELLIGNANPPTSVVDAQGIPAPLNGFSVTVQGFVPNGWYYEVTGTGSVGGSWVEMV